MDSKSVEKTPGILIVGSSSVGKRTILSRKFLSSSSSSSAQLIKIFDFNFSNKLGCSFCLCYPCPNSSKWLFIMDQFLEILTMNCDLFRWWAEVGRFTLIIC